MILHCQLDKIEFIIRDNGKGLDMKTSSSTGFGLGIMQERAKGIGAVVIIESQPDQGTPITVVCQNNLTEGNQ